ncbi:MAG: S-layer homology domain-containing protein, partial [Clostridia bacterium]|nr:S-layer homology domain-containing protein [Clostridia bacterium]
MKKTLKFFALVLVAAQLLAFAVTAADAKTAFTDVKESRWSYANIMWAVENGYMGGVSADKFSPAGTTTRAMVVTVLYRLAGSPAVVFTDTFKDVPQGKWFTDAVVWAAQKDIVNGTTPTTFAPNANITREQLAAIFYRYADFDYVKTDGVAADLSVYADVKKVSSYAKDAMAWANKVGLVNGVTADTLNPKGNATREQFAAILNRYATYEGFKYRTAYNAPVPKSTYTEPE